jgi:hypothetical protein
MKNHFIVCSMFLLLGSCVSVNLPGKKVVSAKDVSFEAPSSPFKEIKMANVDKAWLSDKTANTISYFSECGNTADPSLESLESDALSAMNDINVLKSENVQFNGRESRQTLVSGKLDGVPVKMSLILLKKNGCNYTLSYGGTASQFSQEESSFENFKRNFRAP